MKRLLSVFGLMLIVLAVSSTPAHAAPGRSSAHGPATPERGVCFATPAAADGTKIEQPAGTPTGCFNSIAEATAVFGPETIQANSVIGTIYEYSFYISPALDIWVSNNTALCADGVNWVISNLNPGWNDRISSVKAYGTCTAILYQDINFSGATYVCPRECPQLGSFTNQASSIRFYRV